METKLYSQILPILFLLLVNGSEDTGIPLSHKIEAATATANANSYCVDIQPYYWEIGDKDGVIASGSTGDQTITRTTFLPIASASKWVFGAYVIQAKSGILDYDTIEAITMSSGYTSLDTLSCVPYSIETVNDCFNLDGNNQYTSRHDHKFYYNGGHFQKLAVDMGIGPLSRSELTAEFGNIIGADVSFAFASPQLAGGISTTARQYGIFLQKILDQQLMIYDHLGANSICTNPVTCSDAIASPFIGQDFHYSYGHWVEDDPHSGDGTFSSAGLFGFYPWINADKTLYGVISRYEVPGEEFGIRPGADSQACGSRIRKAFETGMPQ